MSDVKEWVRVARTAQGVMTVTVTLQEGQLVSKWGTKTAMSTLRREKDEARRYAEEALEIIKEMTSD